MFEDLYMDTMPVAYVDVMILEFKDGRIWEIDIKEQLKSNHPDAVAKKLLDTLSEFKETIKSLDFKIDIEMLKADIKKRTNNIL